MFEKEVVLTRAKIIDLRLKTSSFKKNDNLIILIF